jgi:hypothetical protein
MSAGREAVIRRAQRVLAQPAPEGANVIIVGHGNLMRAATGAYASEGGSGVYAPRAGSEPGFQLVGRLSPDDWMRLAELVEEDGCARSSSERLKVRMPAELCRASEWAVRAVREVIIRYRTATIRPLTVCEAGARTHPLLLPRRRSISQHLGEPQSLRLALVPHSTTARRLPRGRRGRPDPPNERRTAMDE